MGLLTGLLWILFFLGIICIAIFGVSFFIARKIIFKIFALFNSPQKQAYEDLSQHPEMKIMLDEVLKLDKLIKKISPCISPFELEKVKHLKNNLLQLLPCLEEMNATDYDLHVVKQTLTDYFPAMLTTYLELPTDFTKTHKMRNGKTAHEVFIEELTVLDDAIEKIVLDVNNKDAEALIIQAEFLKSKFANQRDFL